MEKQGYPDSGPGYSSEPPPSYTTQATPGFGYPPSQASGAYPSSANTSAPQGFLSPPPPPQAGFHPPPPQVGAYPPQQQGMTRPQVVPTGGYPDAYPVANKQPQAGTVYYQPGGTAVQATVVVQPGVYVSGVQDYLIANIFACICCCWIIGIFGIIWSVKTRDSIASGDHQRAMENSRTAKNLLIASIVGGIIVYILNVSLRVATGLY